MRKPRVRVYPDAESLSAAAAQLFADIASVSVEGRGSFSVALSGGNTPLGLFRRLGGHPYREELPWTDTHLFWGDERLVPPDHPGSNYAQAKPALIDRVDIPEEQIHRVKGELAAEAAVEDYRKQIRQYLPLYSHRFDLVLLGMGSDGHTASLFPGPISSQEEQELVIAVTAEYEDRPAKRLTLTPRIVNRARHVIFMVTGDNKADTLAAVLDGPRLPEKLPAQRIRPTEGDLTWLVDRAAAAKLRVG